MDMDQQMHQHGDAHDQPDPANMRQIAGGTRFDPSTDSQAQRVLLLAIRLLFLVILVTVALLPFVGTISDQAGQRGFGTYIIPFLATLIFGIIVVAIDVATPQKRLATVFGIYFGIVAGLVGAFAVGVLLDLVAESWDLQQGTVQRAYFDLFKLAIGITLCYLAVSIVLTTKDDLRLVIPYVEFAKQVRGVRPLLIDTSVLIDGRITNLCETGMLDVPMIVPQFVIEELQQLADSSDKLKRERGRRGLNVVSKLQQNPLADVTVDATEVPGARAVDHKLLQVASEQQMRILTTDYNLNRVAQIQGVTVLNLNDLANALKSQVIPGQALRVELVKRGESPDQGVGYLPDGTMVVVQDGVEHIGEEIEVAVTNSLKTAAGRMIFAKPMDAPPDDAPDDARAGGDGASETEGGAASSNSNEDDDEAGDQRAQRMADSATHQPRATQRPTTRKASGRRNPRR